MKQIFELATAFVEGSSREVGVCGELVPVLEAASKAAGKYVIEADAEIGALFGWKRRVDLEQARAEAVDDGVAQAVRAGKGRAR